MPARLVREVAERFGRIDVLVNNAGLSIAKPALEPTAEDFDTTFAVDVRAAFLATQEAARRMADGGVIVNVTSVHEHVPRTGFAVYASAKAALGMRGSSPTRALRHERELPGRRRHGPAGRRAPARLETALLVGERAVLGRHQLVLGPAGRLLHRDQMVQGGDHDGAFLDRDALPLVV